MERVFTEGLRAESPRHNDSTCNWKECYDSSQWNESLQRLGVTTHTAVPSRASNQLLSNFSIYSFTPFQSAFFTYFWLFYLTLNINFSWKGSSFSNRCHILSISHITFHFTHTFSHYSYITLPQILHPYTLHLSYTYKYTPLTTQSLIKLISKKTHINFNT